MKRLFFFLNAVCVFALLVGNAAASLARGLAGSLAFAAAAVFCALAKVPGGEGLNMCHDEVSFRRMNDLKTHTMYHSSGKLSNQGFRLLYRMK